MYSGTGGGWLVILNCHIGPSDVERGGRTKGELVCQ